MEKERIIYNETGERRKAMAMVISDAIGEPMKYLGAPTMSYQVGPFEITRDGAVTFYKEQTGDTVITEAMDALNRHGFTPANVDAVSICRQAIEDIKTEQDASPEIPQDVDGIQPETIGLEVSLPASCANENNLKALVGAKAELIRKSLGIEELPIEFDEGTVSFPWFPNGCDDSEITSAFPVLCSMLCDMSTKQKRVTAKAKEVDNDRYAFRCFLLRLGMIGPEYKPARHALLKNLTGSSAFKDGCRPEKVCKGTQDQV